jgi:hypothetical protein
MKSIVNSTITALFRPYYRRIISRAQPGVYKVKPSIAYVSQFVGIKPSSLQPTDMLKDKKEIRLFGAKDAKEFTFWAWRDCGIACVLMVLRSRGKGKNETMMSLTKEGIKLGGYVLYKNKKFIDKGWFHQSLIDLLKKHGVNSHMKKWQSFESVTVDMLRGKTVILSMLLPGRRNIAEDGSFEEIDSSKAPSGHLVVATKVKIGKNKQAEGIYVHDPRGLPKYQKDTFIPARVFNTLFTNRSIVVE